VPTRNHRSFWVTLLSTFCGLILMASTIQAKTKLQAGATCELQEKITVRNKAQRKNVKTRQLDKGSTFKIVRYHRVWVRIQTKDGISFATPKSIRQHCRTPEPKPVKVQAPKQSDQSVPGVSPPPQPEAPKPEPAEEAKAAPPQPEASPVPVLAPEQPVQKVQVPSLIPSTERRATQISPAAWVALGSGALCMGASAYFVSQLTTQDEATTGQAALLSGTAGMISIVIGLSYILSPEKPVSPSLEDSEEGISTTISVGPSSIALSGRF
jgi:outer membrane biosynthesis protein TonB